MQPVADVPHSLLSDKIYRKKSLLIHPDRFKHPRGPEAFDLLKKAQTELLDAEKRKILDRTMYVHSPSVLAPAILTPISATSDRTPEC